MGNWGDIERIAWLHYTIFLGFTDSTLRPLISNSRHVTKRCLAGIVNTLEQTVHRADTSKGVW